VILSLNKKKIETLNKGAIVGTSSIRRKIELKKIRPDLIIKQIRGNVETRIMKLKQGNYDAIILAAAGLKRLKVEEHFEEINIKTITPSPGQAVIAIVIKKKSELVSVLKKINNKKTFIESNCERTYLEALDGSCETPIGALATLNENKKKILFNYMASSVDGEKYIKGKVNFELRNYKKLSFDLGTKIKKMIKK
jgi:hydroxymethylbilane synthase